MKFEDKNYEKDINFEILEKKIKELNYNSPENFCEMDKKIKENSVEKNFHSDRNYSSKTGVTKETNKRYSQMTSQEAEDTFARRKMLLMQNLNAERNRVTDNKVNNSTDITEKYEQPICKNADEYIIYPASSNNRAKSNQRSIKKDSNFMSSSNFHKPKIMSGNSKKNPSTRNTKSIFNREK